MAQCEAKLTNSSNTASLALGNVSDNLFTHADLATAFKYRVLTNPTNFERYNYTLTASVV
jgi:hypothetical protein